jgi:hypothetical protein
MFLWALAFLIIFLFFKLVMSPLALVGKVGGAIGSIGRKK